LLTENDEDSPPTGYVKTCPGHLFKHEVEALKHKSELITNLDRYAMKRFYKLKKCCFGLKLDKKSLADAITMKLGDAIRP